MEEFKEEMKTFAQFMFLFVVMPILLFLAIMSVAGCSTTPKYAYHYAEWVTVTKGFYAGQEGQVSSLCTSYKSPDAYGIMITAKDGEIEVCIPATDLKRTEFTHPNG